MSIIRFVRHYRLRPYQAGISVSRSDYESLTHNYAAFAYTTSRAPNAGHEQEVFLVLEGGGAKGIAHIGALHALNYTETPSAAGKWPRLEIIGTAGTSIGAVIAALIAVGYKAREIIRLDGGQPLVRKLLGTKPEDEPHLDEILGDGGWERIRQARSFLPDSPDIRRTLLWFAATSAAAGAALSTILFFLVAGVRFLLEMVGVLAVTGMWLPRPADPMIVMLSIILGTMVAGTGVAYHRFRRIINGVLSTQRIVELLDVALRDKLEWELERRLKERIDEKDRRKIDRDLEELREGGRVLFRHVPMPLRIVAANVSRKELKLFSRRDTPDVAVADAIAASIAIPVLFKAMRLRGINGLVDRYQDGGLVSHIPVWVFDRHRSLATDSRTIAIEIASDEKHETMAKGEAASFLDRHFAPFREMFFDTIFTAAFGARDIQVRVHDRLDEIKVETNIKLLDFHYHGDPLARSIQRSYLTAQAELAMRLCNRPHERNLVCTSLARYVRDLFWGAGADAAAGTVRVAIVRPAPDAEVLRIIRACQFNLSNIDDVGQPVLDDRVLLPIDGSLCGLVYESGRPHVEEGTEVEKTAFPRHVRDRYRRAMRNQAIAELPISWRWAIPVNKDGGIEGTPGQAAYVVCLEGDEAATNGKSPRVALGLDEAAQCGATVTEMLVKAYNMNIAVNNAYFRTLKSMFK